MGTSSPGCWPPGYKEGDKKVEIPYKVIKHGGVRACDCKDTTLNEWETTAHLPFLRKWLGPGVRVHPGDDCNTFNFTAVVPWSETSGENPKQICATDSHNNIDYNAPPQYYYSYGSNVEMASFEDSFPKHNRIQESTEAADGGADGGADGKHSSSTHNQAGTAVAVVVVVLVLMTIGGIVAFVLIKKSRTVTVAKASTFAENDPVESDFMELKTDEESPDEKDPMSLYWTAYSHAKTGNHTAMTAALMELSSKDRSDLLSKTHGDNPTTMMHTAAYNNHLECVRELIRLGAPATIENSYGELPLDCAQESGNADMIDLLQEHS